VRTVFNSFIFPVSIFYLLFVSGCAPYKIETESFLNYPPLPQKSEEGNQTLCMPENAWEENKKAALSHWLYRVVPKHRCQIQWHDIGHWLTWMLFGNDDDGIFGEEYTSNYRPHQKVSVQKALRWMCRNPLHNFCFYVIGTAYRQNSELTLLEISKERFCFFSYHQDGKNRVFPSKSSCIFLALHGGKPFFSLRLAYHRSHQAEFYLGWRDRGNFGIKCLPFHRKKLCEQDRQDL
jgi:hypothetical protein